MMERKTAWIRWIIITCFLLDSISCLQFTPVGLSGSGDGECALILNGPGRSSAFDYSLNLLRGGNGFGFNGPNTCITYDAVNAAYLEARKRIQVAQPHGDYKPEDVATVGELLLDISVNLARTYGLSYEDIEKGLPLIDTSKTLIREVCPPFLSNVECRPGKYRRFDGLCTNLENPTWGSTMQPFTRLIGPLYADGMTAPRISVTGNQLPLARVVSRTMHPDEGFHDHAGTVMVIAWGQFIDHDYTLTATPLDPLNRNDPEECCKRPPHLKNPYCNEILIPEDDYFYRLFSVRCIDFVRGFPAARPGCRLGSRSQYNTLTGVLDANTVYGVTEKFSRKLRNGYGGQLRMNPVFREYGLKDLLPLKLDIPDEGCTRPNRSMYCFEAGEIRVNEQLVLTCMHTLMAREHNRIAEALSQVNPHWDDETLFQEARRINIAEVQHITYNEFLPILLGKEVMEKFGLLLQKDGYWDGYDPSVNPNVIDAFAAAAYRFGHSLLPTAVERWSKAHKFIASKRLSDLIRRPYDLYRAGVIDEYFMGLMNQVAQAMDDSITQEVTNHLFKKVGARYGMDLVSFNMQRGREFGLPGYMEFRKFCGLPGAENFDELFGSMPNDTIKRYTTIFEHPSDVDLWSGGVSERPLPGSMLGPTFACVIATQFSYSRRGDRFWYELPNQPSSFTPEQLKEIRKARLARVICDNTDLIDTIQLYPMVLPDHEINPRVPCRSGVLPSIDFTKWADHGNPSYHQQFINNHVQSTETKPKIINLTKGTLYKLPQTNIYGKHPYASLFKTQIPKNIKILPPLVLKSPYSINENITIFRTKRNIDKSNNFTLNNVSSDTVNQNESLENGTASPIVDQVTQAITVTEISGTPPSDSKKDSRPLNFQPFVITSSDFKNTTDNLSFNLEEIVDVDKFIQEKIKKVKEPNFYFESADIDNEKTKENLEEQEESKTESQQLENQKETADYDEEKESEEDNIKPENQELIIHVPDVQNHEDSEEQLEIKEEIDEESQNKEENVEEESPSIPDSFVTHFVKLGAINEKPEQITHETRENSDINSKKTAANVKLNEENFYLPLSEESEENEETKEKDKYFDNILKYQIELNEKLEHELEYPDLDKEYEQFRENSHAEYFQNKVNDLKNLEKPYDINSEGIYSHDEQNEDKNEEERNYKDEVDIGTDKERQQETEEYKENEDKDENEEITNAGKKEYDEEDENEEITNTENEEYEEEDENEELTNTEKEEYEKDNDEENEREPSEKKYTIIPNNNTLKENQKDERLKTEQIKNLYKIEKEYTNQNINEEKDKENKLSTTENVVQALKHILEKKDAISRQQDIDNPKEYKTYWSLTFETPRQK